MEAGVEPSISWVSYSKSVWVSWWSKKIQFIELDGKIDNVASNIGQIIRTSSKCTHKNIFKVKNCTQPFSVFFCVFNGLS